MWSYLLVETITGDVLAPATVASPSMGRRLNTAARSSFVVDTSRWSAAEARTLLESWTVSVVPHWNGQPVLYAPIVGRARAGVDLVQVECRDVRVLADARFPFEAGAYWSTPPWEMFSLDIPSSVLRALEWPFGSAYEPKPNRRARLPFVENYYESGDVFWRVPNHQFKTAGSIVNDLQSRDGGPVTEVRPQRRTDGGVDLFVFVGRTSGYQSFEYVAPAGRDVVSWSWADDAQKQYTGIFVSGEGSDTSMKVGQAQQRASNPYAGPLRDAVFAMKDISDQAVLDSHARALRDLHERPTVQLSLTVRAGQVDPSTRLGSRVRVWPVGEKLLDDRWYETTLVGMSMDGTRNVSLELQETR